MLIEDPLWEQAQFADSEKALDFSANVVKAIQQNTHIKSFPKSPHKTMS